MIPHDLDLHNLPQHQKPAVSRNVFVLTVAAAIMSLFTMLAVWLAG